MKSGNAFTRKDVVAALVCIIFLLANLAAINQGGRMRAKEAVCLSNLMKWGQIFQAYTADNDGFFHSRTQATSFGYSRLWPYVYKPYYNDPMMRFCPTAANPHNNTGTFGVWNYSRFGSFRPTMDPSLLMPGEREYNPDTGVIEEGFFTGSYGMSRYIENIKGGTAGTNPDYWRRVEIKGGDKVPILLDAMFFYYWPYANAVPPAYEGDWTTPEMRWICINRHTGYINAVFMDFSARKVGLKELWTLKHSRSFDTCGPWTTCGGVQPNDWPEWMRDFKDY